MNLNLFHPLHVMIDSKPLQGLKPTIIRYINVYEEVMIDSKPLQGLKRDDDALNSLANSLLQIQECASLLLIHTFIQQRRSLPNTPFWQIGLVECP